MAAGAGVLFGVVLLFAVVAPLVLYLLVREEGEWDVMDRDAAERAARRDHGDDERSPRRKG